MMTKEEVAQVITYCEKNKISYKQRQTKLIFPAIEAIEKIIKNGTPSTMKSHSRRSVTGPHTSRPLTELPPKHIHGITDNDVPAIELTAVNLGNAQNLGIGKMTAEQDQKPDKSEFCSVLY